MSFIRLDPSDLVISADSVVVPTWSTGASTLSTFYTSSAQVASDSGKYYYDIYNANPASGSTSQVQFSIAFGHPYGSGSSAYNSTVVGKSPTSTVYGQYRTLLLGDENSSFNGAGDVDGVFIIAISRSRFKEKIKPGSFQYNISADPDVRIVDDTSATTVTYSDAGRVFNLKELTSLTVVGKSYPDVGIVVIDRTAYNNLDTPELDASLQSLFNILVSSPVFLTSTSQETVTSNYVFARTRNSECNYTTNPSLISGSGEIRFTSLIENPQTFPTTVGLYNDNLDLLAVAKLSSPLKKDFTKESLLRIKLDF